MKGQRPTIVFLSMEMMIPELGNIACNANFKGGLGIFAGDVVSSLSKLGFPNFSFVPFYHHDHKTREAINYEKSYADSLILTDQEKRFGLKRIYLAKRGGSVIFGLEKPDIFDIIYTEDRRQRLRQEILMGKIPAQIMKRVGIKPDILWINESHTVLAIPEIREDSYFDGTKILFTIHTPEQAGMEKFWDFRFDDLQIDPSKYYDIFVKNGVLDLTWAGVVLADKVNAVSQEHAEITRKMFPQFKSKIIGIRNGSDIDFWLSERIKDLGNEFSLDDFQEVHQFDKNEGLDAIERKSDVALDRTKPTVWWVRRIAQYKNQYPMLKDIICAICASRGTFVNTSFGKIEGLGLNMIGAGRCAESDNTCLFWIEEFNRWNDNSQLRGKFVFLPEYDLELLRFGARGSDVWLCTPEPGREACGTSEQRAIINGNPVLTTKTGGPKEYIQEFNPTTCSGNGFFIDPYNPKVLYEKLKIISDLYYAWLNNGNNCWPTLRMNAYKTGMSFLDSRLSLEEYNSRIFDILLR